MGVNIQNANAEYLIVHTHTHTYTHTYLEGENMCIQERKKGERDEGVEEDGERGKKR